MRQKTALFIVSLAAMLFAACGQKGGITEPVSVTQPPVVTSPENIEPTKEAIVTSTPEPTTAPTATPSPTATPAPVDRTAANELVAKINVGWNLGNTFDAHGAKTPVANETYWGNPFTTREMLEAIYDQGFNSIRIPVTWAQGIGAAPEYKVDEELLSRVETVVRDCLDIGFFVILNTHHEPDYWLKPTTEGLEEVEAKLRGLWTQLAMRFEDCDEHLIFEGMNEPRIKGSKQEWNGGTKEERAAVNKLNSAFVDVVRKTGGNNETRLLILCTYGNSVTPMTMFDMHVPADPYLAVAVHLYTPYYFTFDVANSYANWSGAQKSEITNTFAQVKEYLLKKNIPVLITEFGAVNKRNKEDNTSNLTDRLKWLTDYMSEANKLGLKCYWWDNGNHAGTGERFGIFNRTTLTFTEPEIADALVANAVSTLQE